ncbi:dihydroorotase [bacterium]|nr:dihydroorotase [bacterium]
MIIINGKIVLPNVDEPVDCDIRVNSGKIVEIGAKLARNDEILDAEGYIVLPGAIDPHTHFDDPGYTEREDFYCGTSAAASGGITTIIDMPCTSVPPVTNLDNFREKLAAIENKAVIDFGLYGGVSGQSFEQNFPENIIELAPFVLGFKTYFISGMGTFARLNHWQFEQVVRKAIELQIPVLVHAEDFDYIDYATKIARANGDKPYDYYLSRPEIAEVIAVQDISAIVENILSQPKYADIVEKSGIKPVHIVHISTAKSIEIISGKSITCETAPHYLAFDLDDFVKIGSPLKVTPIVKSSGNREYLWEYLANGEIDFVASDHAPAQKNEKFTGSIWTDYSGIPGTGTLLPYLFSEGYIKEKISLKRLVEVTSSAAAKRYGIYHRKGSIEVGKDADFAIIDPNSNWKVDGEKFYSKGKITAFDGYTFHGKIVKTIVRGKIVYDYDEGIIAPAGYGDNIAANMNSE